MELLDTNNHGRVTMEKDIIKKASIELCKVAINGNKKRSNLVTVNIELRRLENGKPEFSACGTVWNATKTDGIRGGQCIDELASPAYMKQYPKDIRDFMSELKYLWTNYHLNGMYAGTPEQERLVKAYFKKTGEGFEYGKAINYLKKIKKHIVLHNGQKYQYGSGWLTHDIPKADFERIEKLFSFVPKPIKGIAKPKHTAEEVAEFLLENVELEEFQKEALTEQLNFSESLGDYINEDTTDYAEAVGEWCKAHENQCEDGDADFGKEHIEEILEYIENQFGTAELGEFVKRAIQRNFFRYFAAFAIEEAVRRIADYNDDKFIEFLEAA